LTLTINELLNSSEGIIDATPDDGVFTVTDETPSGPTVSISNGSADAGATTTVTITADAVTDLTNFDITVTYDSNVVNVTAADNGDFGGTNNLENAATGTVRLLSFNVGGGQTGDGIVLSTLTLESVGTAGQTSTLTLTINELLDSSEDIIDATPIDGLFTVTGVPGAAAPTITSSVPTSPAVSDIAWATQTFSIGINQTVNVTWLINGSEVLTNESVNVASYTNTSAEVGCWNVSAVASNGNGDVMQKWTWTVAPGDVTSINVTGLSTMVIGANETFDANCYNANNYPIDDATVAWDSSNPYVGTINETTGYFEALNIGRTNIAATRGGVTSDPVRVTVNGAGSSGNDTESVIDDFVNVTGNYTENLTVRALGNVTAAVPNGTTIGLGDMIPFKGANVTIDQSLGAGEWVRIEMNYTDDELNALGIDEDTLEIYVFNETSAKWELGKDQPYCIGHGRDKDANGGYLWVNVTELSIFALVGQPPAPPARTGGGGGGGDGTYPPEPAPTPAATPEPAAAEPTVASAEAPTEALTKAPTKAPTATPTKTTTELKTEGTPGFGAVVTVFAIAGLLVATYLVMRRRE
jgi:hypothetical protein